MPPVDLVLLIFAILLGLVFGSFLNVCVVRLPQGGSINTPRSQCPSCHRPIRPRDNVPVLSWLVLRGHCRDCGAKISARYPLVETATAVLFAACFLRFGLSLEGIGMTAFCWLLLGLLLMDAETFLLPDALTLPGVVAGVLYAAMHALGWQAGLWQALLGGLADGGFLMTVSILYQLIRRRQGMGFGDVKLGVMLGVWLGWRMGAVALFLAIVAGGIIGITLAIRHRRREAVGGSDAIGSVRLPLGTFLGAAGIVTVFAGEPLLHWYLGFFPN